MKSKKTGIIVLIIVAAAILSTAIVVILGGNGRKLKKQLDLGQKYLSEMNYEEAIASFEKALEIDPMSAEAYLGMADAYIGMGDLESAKATLEKGIEILSSAGKDTTALESKLAEVEKLIMESNQAEDEQINTEASSEEENIYPTISIEPIISALSNVWGRNWLDWTLEDFVANFNLPQLSEGNWEEERSEEKYQNRASINDWGSQMWTEFHYREGKSVYENPCKSLNYTSDTTIFSQEIKWYEYNEAIPENPVIHDDLCAFAEENGIGNLSDVAGYFGLDINEIGDYEAPMKVNTEYGMAEVSYIKSESGDGYYDFITVNHIENLEGFYFTFTECGAYFRFEATQHK